MKPAKALLALLAFLGFTSAASAAYDVTTASDTPTVVHIIGSTAYRNRTNLAVIHLMGAQGNFYVASSSNAKTVGSSQTYFKGSFDGTNTVIVETNFIGSISGLKGLTTGLSFPFIADAPATEVLVASGATLPSSDTNGNVSNDVVVGGTNSPLGNSQPGDVTLCDVYQTSSLYKTPALKGAATGGAPEIVGVIPFTWARTPSADANISSISNITPQLIDLLYSAGSLPASLFTGNSADASKLIYAAGRDPDSGTRLTAFAEAGLGTNATVRQYRPTNDGSPGISSGAVSGLSTSGTINSVEIWPTDTVTNLGLTFTGGNGGENSGGTLMGYISNAFSIGTAGAMIAYSGTDDANSSIKAGAVPLSYNGYLLASGQVLGTTAPTYNFSLIENGQYSFWGYEHMLYTSGLSGLKKTFSDSIAKQIHDVDAILLISSMNVSRPGDGGQVAPK